MSPKLNLNLQDAVDFTPLDDGEYPVVVAEFSDVQTGPKSNYITATLEVEEGHENAGRRLWMNLPIMGKGAGIFVDFINKCTGENYKVSDLDELEIDTDELVGSTLTAIVKQEEYPEGSGDMRAQLQSILAR